MVSAGGSLKLGTLEAPGALDQCTRCNLSQNRIEAELLRVQIMSNGLLVSSICNAIRESGHFRTDPFR